MSAQTDQGNTMPTIHRTDVDLKDLNEGDSVAADIVCCDYDMQEFSGGRECGFCSSFVLINLRGKVTDITINN